MVYSFVLNIFKVIRDNFNHYSFIISIIVCFYIAFPRCLMKASKEESSVAALNDLPQACLAFCLT